VGVGGQCRQDTEWVLQRFRRTMQSARKAYVEFVGDQMRVEKRIVGGGSSCRKPEHGIFSDTKGVGQEVRD
jgi:hypothetical protein